MPSKPHGRRNSNLLLERVAGQRAFLGGESESCSRPGTEAQDDLQGVARVPVEQLERLARALETGGCA